MQQSLKCDIEERSLHFFPIIPVSPTPPDDMESSVRNLQAMGQEPLEKLKVKREPKMKYALVAKPNTYNLGFHCEFEMVDATLFE